jgi:hypothetical protein
MVTPSSQVIGGNFNNLANRLDDDYSSIMGQSNSTINLSDNRQNHVAFNQPSNQSCNKNNDINKPFKIFHQNIRGVQGKINELMISLLNEKPNIICLTEHHLTDYEMGALYIPKYKLGAGYGRKKFKN